MKKALLLFVALFCFSSYAQGPPPPGCHVLTEVDNDNDGFTEFDLAAYFIQFRTNALSQTNFDLSGYAIEFYPSETDYHQETNLITSSLYTNIVSHEQFCWMKLIYTGSGPLHDQQDLDYYFTCHILRTTSALATTAHLQHSIQLYPNPVSDILYVKANNETDFSISIFDLNSRLLMEKQNATTIDVSKLHNGIYVVNITSKGKIFSQKITVAN
jgi:hypothetical protein